MRWKLPTLSLGITDAERILERIGLQDGIKIRIVLKATGRNAETYNFRKFNHKSTFNGQCYEYLITGYLDYPLYLLGTTAAGIRGTSSTVMSAIADRTGLKYLGDTTSDSMLWMPQNKPWCVYGWNVASYGYLSDSSCMVNGVDFDGTLRYFDVNNLKGTPIKALAYAYAEDAITVTDMQAMADSGLGNSLTGFNNGRYVQSIAGDSHTLVDQLAFTPNSRAPLYNKTVKETAGRGAFRFGPISVGNVHANYERAHYQNMRYKNLFSMGLGLLVNTPTEIRQFDRINLSVQKEDTSQDTSTSGVYVVSGRAILVQGVNYAERLEVIRHGTNENYVSG